MKTGSDHSFYAKMVRTLSRRRHSLSVLTSVLILTAVVVTLYALLAVLDSRVILTKSLRTALLFAVGIAGALFLGWQWWRSRRVTTPEDTVLRMERAQPASGQQLRTAWEVAGKPAPPSANDEGPRFGEALLQEAQFTVRSRSWEHLLPTGRLLRWLAGAAACVVLTALSADHWPDFSLALRRMLNPFTASSYTQVDWTSSPDRFDDRNPPRLAVEVSGRTAAPVLHLRETGTVDWQLVSLTALPDGRGHDVIITGKTENLEAYVEAGDGITRTILLKYQPTPRLIKTQVTVQMPDYTGRAAELREGGDVKAVEGSTFAWEFTFNTPPGRAEYQITSATDAPAVIPLETNGDKVRAVWTAPVGKFAGVLTVFDVEGTAIDSWKYELAGEKDKLPKVEILEPSKDIEATAIAELPVRIRARDDYGVAELGLILEAAGQKFWTIEKTIEAKDVKDLTEMTRAMLETVPLTVRDNVRVYAYALDHKPRGGPRGVSPLRAIDIKQFKMRSMYLGKMKGPPITAEQITKINDLINAERVVVSDIHLLKEEARTESAAALTGASGPIVEKQSANQIKTQELRAMWESDPSIPQDDVILLGTAESQMGETLPPLGRGLVEKAFVSSDRALSSLLQIRKHLLKLIMEGQSENPEPSESKPLVDLAKEAARLAKEELTVKNQIAPPSADSAKVAPEISRRQQEVALSDAGELYAAIVSHEKKNDAMVGLMRDAETAMKQADETLRTPDPASAQAPLVKAEQHLQDLADFINAMDEDQLAETLKQMAAKAKEDAEKAKSKESSELAKNDAPKPGSKPGEKLGSKPGEKSGTSPAGSPGSAPGEGAAGSGEGKSPSPENEIADSPEAKAKREEEARAALAEAARNAALADEILKALAAQAQPAGEEETPDADASSDEPGTKPETASRKELEQLRSRTGTENLAKDLKNLTAKTEGAGEPKDAASPQGMGQRLEDMARQLQAEAAQLDSSRLARLAAVRAQAKAIREKLQKEQQAKQKAEERELQKMLASRGFPPGSKVRINGKTITVAPPGEETGTTPGTEGKTPGSEGTSPGETPGAPGGGNGNPDSDTISPPMERFVVDARKLNDNRSRNGPNNWKP